MSSFGIVEADDFRRPKSGATNVIYCNLHVVRSVATVVATKTIESSIAKSAQTLVKSCFCVCGKAADPKSGKRCSHCSHACTGFEDKGTELLSYLFELSEA